MENSLKRKTAAAVAAAVMVLSTATCVFAAATTAPATTRPRPGSGTTTTTTSGTSSVDSGSSGSSSSGSSSSGNSSGSTSGSSSSDDTSSGNANDTGTSSGSTGKTRTTASPAETTPEATMAVETAAPQAGTATGGVSKGGMFVWFLLSVLVNGIISFAIGNRFYKLSKKDSHVTSEIRALRRDVEEKFVRNVGGFAESEFDINNDNEDYSMDEEGVRMVPVSSHPKTAEDDEMFKRWEEQRAQRRAALKRTVEAEPEFDDDDDTRTYSKRKKYQPKRTASVERDYDDDDMYEETREIGLGAVKNKAKEFLGDIFPFKED